MISITDESVWVSCKSCKRWTKLTECSSVLLYTFTDAPVLNWALYVCTVCDEDKSMFIVDFSDPGRLLTELRNCPTIEELERPYPTDFDLDLFAATHGHVPRLVESFRIESAVAQFAWELRSLESSLDQL